MAEEALKKLEEQLNCSVCLDTYTQPKQLLCHHVYCQHCLVKLVHQDQQGQAVLTCPICRQVTPVPVTGVTGLQTAFHINHLLEIQDVVKKIKAPSPSAQSEVSAATSASPPPVIVKCSEHAEELRLYCETCGQLICFQCIMRDSKHHSHDYQKLEKAFEQYKGEIVSSLEPMENQLTVISEALKQLDSCCGEISDQQSAIEARIHSTFRRLQEILDARKAELIGQLHRLVERKLKCLSAQRDQVETTQAQLGSCLCFVKESLEAGDYCEVLKMKKTIVDQVHELTATFQPELLQPSAHADVLFNTSEDTTVVCKSFGQVFTLARVDDTPLQGAETAIVGEVTTVLFQALSADGLACEEPIESLECVLVSEQTIARVRGSVERKGVNQYAIGYRPSVKGRHQLHVRVERNHIRGSPFAMVAKSADPTQLGVPILSRYDVDAPYGAAVDRVRGSLVVTEANKHCVSVFRLGGGKVRSFGTRGAGPGEFSGPGGVELDDSGNILVADCDNCRVQKFTSEGRFLAAVGSKGREALQFKYPGDISFNPRNNKIYVTDTNNHRVQVLKSDLTFSHTFGTHGSDDGQFDTPLGIACDSTGKVYVADSANHRVQVFTAEGAFVSAFQRSRGDSGELRKTFGISVDDTGTVYVSEHVSHSVSVFTSEGQYVTSFGRKGEGPGDLKFPYGLALDVGGVVYVCDSGNNRIQAF